MYGYSSAPAGAVGGGGVFWLVLRCASDWRSGLFWGVVLLDVRTPVRRFLLPDVCTPVRRFLLLDVRTPVRRTT
jgi:hypothetical protein